MPLLLLGAGLWRAEEEVGRQRCGGSITTDGCGLGHFGQPKEHSLRGGLAARTRHPCPAGPSAHQHHQCCCNNPAGLREHLRRPGNWEALIHDTYVSRDVVVLPAFETKPGAPLEEGRGIAMRAFEGKRQRLCSGTTKQELLDYTSN